MKFIFENYAFDTTKNRAEFNYKFSDGRKFRETVGFAGVENPSEKLEKNRENHNAEILNRALFLVFVLIGTSYWKTFGDAEIELDAKLDAWQANFFNQVFQEGMGQFAFENKLSRADLAHFSANEKDNRDARKFDGRGILTLQSGGKDSLLTATLLRKNHAKFTPWFVASGNHHPKVLDELGENLAIATRNLDRENLEKAKKDDAKNGHVPITYIVQSLALIQSILLNKNQILVSIGHEGVEPHAYIDDLAVNHQWSKTWEAEQLFQNYVHNYISPDIQIGSPIRKYSELKIAELFAKNAWAEFGHKFSSCNVENYRQHADNSVLKWCGDCPKCANAFLIFAPFVDSDELKQLFDGQDLLAKESLEYSFKGLLGVDGVMKPFECVGETGELRQAYHLAQKTGKYAELPFSVPQSDFDYNLEFDHNIELARIFK
jgi:hypothetical protein